METGPSLNVIIGANLDKLHHEMEHAEGIMHHFKEEALDLATEIGAAFGAEKVGEFAFEVSELAAKAHGVKAAFSEIPQSLGLLQQLKETTHDTASEMVLMQDAIHAKNLNIPLKDLGTLLEFAHLRAIETNGDFNSLADTLITAIGKGGAGAKKAMAALQISTEDYKKALEETGSTQKAVMLLAEEAIEKSKGKLDETLESIEGNSAAWADLKVKMGETLNESHVLAGGLHIINDELKLLASDNIQWWEKAIHLMTGGAAKEELLMIDKVNLQKKINDEKEKEAHINNTVNAAMKSGNIDAYVKALGPNENREEIIKRINALRHKEKEELGDIEIIEAKIKELREEQLHAHGKSIHAIQEEIEMLQKKEKLLKSGESIKAVEGQFDKYQKGIKLVREELDKLAQAAYNATHKNATLEETFEKMEKTLQKIGSGKGIVTVIAGYEKGAKEFEKLGKENKKNSDEMMRETERAGAMIGDEMGKMISGQASFAESMSQITSKMIGEYAMKAIAAAGAGAAESSGPFAVAAAAAAMGAMAALFSSMGVSGHGGGEGGSSYVRPADRSPAQQREMVGLNISLDGNFKLEGNNLVAALRKANYYTGKTGG